MNNLEKLDKGVKRDVLRFVLERYGHNNDWVKRMWGISGKGICQLYFKEYVNWIDERREG